ncbi:MAG: hypothetical protein HN334_03370, partial [Candidatus Cloacimonetes bacterium]|nr:hypothetical protein [Candidatus Cloacimonadota bacterium]
MKKILFIIFVLAVTLVQGYEITLSENGSAVEISENSYQKLAMEFNFEKINSFEVETSKGVFNELTIQGTYFTKEIGAPKLPQANELIEIPFGAEVYVQVSNYEVTEYKLSDFGITNFVMPAQPSLSKSQNVDDVEFAYNEETYMQSYRPEMVSVEILGVMRGVRLARLTVNPVTYDASNGTIEVYNNIEVAVTFSGSDADLTEAKRISTYSPYFEAVYRSVVNNRDYEDHPDLTTYPLKMLVIADDMFENNALLNEYVDWKKQKGFEVVENYDLTSSSAIQSWIETQYSQDVVPSFIVIVGDTGQIPASTNGSQSNKATDLYYGSVDGDMFPDIYYSRLSATNDTQLNAQLNKILYYERYEFANPSYLDNATLIAGADGSFNPTHGQPTVLYGTDYYYNTAHGYNDVNLYLTSYGGCYDTVDEGIGFINYTAHGSQTSWADPSLSQGGVNSFTNNNEYPVAIGNCCLAADFGYAECFGETWLRKANGGAVGYIGSAPSSYWDEDVYWSVGSFSYVGSGDINIDDTTWGVYDAASLTDYVSLAGLMTIGNLAVTEDGGGLVEYYWQAYNVLGDASLVMYNTQGYVNSVSYMDILPLGVDYFEVTAEPGSYVAISFEGVLHGAGLIDADGTTEIAITPINNSGMADIVITRPQYQPVIEQVQVAPLSGPFVTIEEIIVNAGSDDIIEFGETVYLTVTLKNVGTETASNVNMNLSENDGYVGLSDASENFGNIVPDGMVTRTNAYTFLVDTNVPNAHNIALDALISAGAETWESAMNLVAYAPELVFENVIVNDANGQVDPDETVQISVYIKNNGGANIDDVAAVLSYNQYDTYMQVIEGTDEVAGIGASSTGIFTFTISATADTPVGHVGQFLIELAGENDYSVNETFSLTVGLCFEDFESGGFTNYAWVTNWEISSESQEGVYAA